MKKLKYNGMVVYSMEELSNHMGKSNAVIKFLSNHRNQLEEGKDYFTVTNEQYEEITGYKKHIKASCFLCSQSYLDKMTHKIPMEKINPDLPNRITVSQKNVVIPIHNVKHEPIKETVIHEIVEPIQEDIQEQTQVQSQEQEEVQEIIKENPSIKPKRKYKRKQKPKEDIIIEPINTEVIPDVQKVNQESNAQVNIHIDLNDIFAQFITASYKQTELLSKQIESQNKQILELSGMMRELINYKLDAPKPAPIIEDEYPTYDTWKKQINSAVKSIVDLDTAIYPSSKGILATAYGLLTKEYGIVWEQSKKEFFNEYGRSPVNTMELCWYIEQVPTNRNLLLAKLNTIYNEAKECK